MSGITSPTAHSRYGASAMKRIMACPASVQRSIGRPNPSTPWAEEGTMLHDIAATALIHYRDGAGAEAFDWGALAKLTTEQVEVVRAYVDTVRDDTGWGFDGEPWAEFIVEERVGIPELHDEFWGTNDCTVVRNRRLTVYDLKCGAGVPVPADEDGKPNPQLAYYMMGAIVRLGGRVSIDNIELPEGVDELEIVVVQPRLGGVKRRMVAVTELLDLAGDMVIAAGLSVDPQAPVKGGEHCRFCPAKRDAKGKPCPGLADRARAAAKSDFAPADMSDAELSAILSEAATIETWLAAVREEAKERMQAGEVAPGWGLRTGRAGNRQWVNPEAAEVALVEWGLPLDAVAPRKLVSPAEAQRLARLHVGEEIDLADMVERKPGAVSIERTATPAAEDFAAAIPSH